MQKATSNAYVPSPESREEFLYPGKNGIETSVAITEMLAGFSGVKKMLDHEKVKEIFRRLNEGNIRYALIGGLAYAQYAPPRATQDVDLVVLSEDVNKVRQLFPDCYLRGTAIAGIYNFEGTRLDVQPAKRRLQISTIQSAVDGSFEGTHVKVSTLVDLIQLKLWAAIERREIEKKLQDQADIASLIVHNKDKITASTLETIANNLLSLWYSPEEISKCREMLQWLNQILDQINLSDRKFPLEGT